MNNIELEGSNTNQDNLSRGGRIKSRQSIHSISWKWPFLLLAAGCVLFYIVHLIDYKLPKPITEDEAIQNTALFSGERARRHMERLVNLGQRIVGSDANEIKAPEDILSTLKELREKVNPAQMLKYDLSSGSGAYNLGYHPPFTNVYVNVNNVMAKLDGSDGNHTILLNCHYDSVPSSVGASDDAVNCAIMLELLTVLSRSDTRLKHTLVFLFNGAEETPLMGAHLFLKHEWSKNIRAFLNLEAGGLGGRSILFQSGPKNSWLLNYYAKNAPYPHGQVFGEELFQSGAVPSDTDFRIFRDFGNVPGLDFAFSRNGYVYHTIYDRSEYIDTGSIQHLGDNLLTVLRHLANAPELQDEKKNADGEVVYFDYMGWFMICYSKTAAIFINLLVVAVSVLSIVIFTGRLSQCTWLPNGFRSMFRRLISGRLRQALDELGTVRAATELRHNYASATPSMYAQAQVYKELGFSAVGTVCGMVLCVLVNAAMGLIVDAISTYSMPFYSRAYLIFPLYWLPGLIAYVLPPMLMDSWREKKRGLSLSLTCQLNLVSAQIPFTLLLFLLTCANVRSAYIIMINVLFSALANITIHMTQLYRSVHRWIWIYLLIHLPSVVIQLYCSLLLYTLFIPIMGRSGPVNADLYISVITAILIIYTTSFIIPLFTLVRRKGFVMVLVSVICLATVLLCLFSSLGLPYKKGPGDPAPQRYWIMHTSRKFYDKESTVRREDSGYFILNLDRNSPRTVPDRLKSGITSLAQDCETEMSCGLPVYTSRMLRVSSTSSWISAPEPNIPVNTEINLISKNCTPTVCRIHLEIKGPDRKTIMFTPRNDFKLYNWNLDPPEMPSGSWQGRDSYFINVVSGAVKEDFQLRLAFEMPEGSRSDSILDIAVAGNHVHHEVERSAEFNKFLADFPDYVTMVGWISSYRAYVF